MATYSSIPVEDSSATSKLKTDTGVTYRSVPLVESSHTLESKPALPVADAVADAEVWCATTPASAVYFTGRQGGEESLSDVERLREENKRRTGVGVMMLTMGNLCFSGKMIVPQKLKLVLLFRGTTVDFSQAIFVHPITTVELVCFFGGGEVILPPGVRRETRGIGIFGGFGNADSNYDSVDINAPLVVIKGLAMFGGAGVSIKKSVAPIHLD